MQPDRSPPLYHILSLPREWNNIVIHHDLISDCSSLSTNNRCTTKMSDLDLLDLSSDLFKIRPIYLRDTHIQQLAPRWRSCCCCRESLEKQVVQMKCCDTIYHTRCLRDFAKCKALVLKEGGGQSVDFFCPWCSTTLNCKPCEVWAFLQEPSICAVLEVGEHLDTWLAYLSELDAIARVKFMTLAREHDEIVGDLVRAVRLPAKVYAVRRLCQGSPTAQRAFEMLYRGRQSSFNTLLEWQEWLTRESGRSSQCRDYVWPWT